ncbi:MAG: hypothetical protein JWR36_681 [Glaciihabitans sp.]|jgi:uncharacterized protein YndB with AHSA1/START domain|nr:hypothetical protein [Glaciihabitans sp.]MDQ1572198.1 hypothetical protein [Actinomycetota bacterium]
MSDIRPAGVSERDLYVTRAFTAPRALVWRFFTEPELVATWFGPDSFHVPVETISINLEVGGNWNLSMVDDDTGEAFPIRGTITQCDPPEYLEMRLGADTALGELEDIMLRLRFHDHGDKTRVTLHQGPFDDIQRDQTEAGWEMSFVKLDGALVS